MAVVHRDLGCANNGLEDWYWQRLSAVVLTILLPLPYILLIWLLQGDVSQVTVLDILEHPVSRMLHSILMLTLLIHAYIGIKVIVEDYVPLKIRMPFLGAMLMVVIGLGFWWTALIWAWGG